MLQAPYPVKPNYGLERREPAAYHPKAGLWQFASALRRQAALVFGCCLAGLLLGGGYLALAAPRYTAKANIVIDVWQARASHGVSAPSGEPRLEAPDIEREIEILRSPKIALAVVTALNLTEDEAFMNPPRTPVAAFARSILDIFGKPGSGLAKTGEDARLPDHGGDARSALRWKASKILQGGIRIGRTGGSYLLQIEYTGPEPARAAEIANAYADAYLLEQLTARVEATRRVRSLLQQPAEELRQMAIESDRAAQRFKAGNNLLAGKGAPGTWQPLAETPSQLAAYRTAASGEQAKYLRIKHIIDDHQTEAAAAESFASPVIESLRAQYLEVAARYVHLARTLPRGYIVLSSLKNAMDETSRLLFEELGRVEQSYRNDYEVALAREKAAVETMSMSGEPEIAAKANEAREQLGELEQKAASYKKLYETYSERYQEAAQQESFWMVDARVANEAITPAEPSEPETSLVLALTVGAGAFAGIAGGIYREVTDRVFRTVEQVHRDLGSEVLGMLPLVPAASLPHSVPGGGAPIMRYVIEDPFSAFAEVLRSAKVAADQALPVVTPKVIGLISLLPKEGKTTVAKNLATQLALQDAKTLLIDADTRNPALTREIGLERRALPPSSTLTLPPLDELLQFEPMSGLDILPCIFAKSDPRIANGFSKEIFQSLLASCGQSYDYIVLDLPPIGPVVNARGLAPLIDAFIFVVAWGSTSRGAVRSALDREPAIRDKLLGVIMNKVDMNKFQVYQHFDSDSYYYERYGKYYKSTG